MKPVPFLGLAIVAGLTSACVMQVPAYAPMTPPVESNLPYNPPIDGMAPMPVAGGSGLQERQPDLCGAKSYASYVGQPGSVVPGLGITRPYRVVEFRGIEAQNYDPSRIVFRLDSAGNIQKVDCG
ncbi:I78 family peptidase inhibitor [Paracoccus sp. (in: a-proteobacteria)]|uniref:I78 family peptidase inhibitor n=1 Tax=Paracoccus sp. TaxID=267 RepID=UPI0026E01792|nr:I78 family peptidase inhibitor [Paracoccus sp. (in: a-proteobacteria)]